VAATARIIGGQLLHGQTNFLRMLWRFSRVYNAERQLGDHSRPVRYMLPEPEQAAGADDRFSLYVHGRHPRHTPARSSGASAGQRP
jgi:magnesium-protoporphyrin IX monomethyl ester (oxidative) cyclase